MSEEKSATKDLVVLSDDQIKAFPLEVRNQMAILMDGARGTELTEFNPLVTELLELNKTVADLKLVAPDEDGKYDKANIQTFVDAKKSIRSYRAKVKEVVKALKAPRIAENKALKAIEDTFVGDATKLFEKAEEVFAPYVQWEADEKKRKEDEKNKKILEAQKAAEDEAEQLRKQNANSNIYTKVRFELIASGITEKASKNIASMSEDGLKNYLNELIHMDYNLLVGNVDTSVLSVEQQNECIQAYTTAQTNAITNVQAKLESFEQSRNLTKAQTEAEVRKEQSQPKTEEAAVPPPPPHAAKAAEAVEKIDAELPPAVPHPPGSPGYTAESFNYRDHALTLLQTLSNAAGATFEDEKMAVDCIEECLKQVCKNVNA